MSSKLFLRTTAVFAILICPVPAISQERFEQKAKRIVNELTNKVGLTNPIKVRIYSKPDIGDIAFFSTLIKVPTLNINKWFFYNLSEEALTYVLAHELGHFFDSAPRLSLSKIGSDFDGQFIADSFALYVLGEDLFRKGRNEMTLMYYYNISPEEHWLFQNDPAYYALQLNHTRERTEWWLTKAKERLDKVPYLISLRKQKQ